MLYNVIRDAKIQSGCGGTGQTWKYYTHTCTGQTATIFFPLFLRLLCHCIHTKARLKPSLWVLERKFKALRDDASVSADGVCAHASVCCTQMIFVSIFVHFMRKRVVSKQFCSDWRARERNGMGERMKWICWSAESCRCCAYRVRWMTFESVGKQFQSFQSHYIQSLWSVSTQITITWCGRALQSAYNILVQHKKGKKTTTTRFNIWCSTTRTRVRWKTIMC